MATYTSNYNLKKPEQNDFYNVEDFNGNMDIIDQRLSKNGLLEIIGVLPIANGGTGSTNLWDIM